MRALSDKSSTEEIRTRFDADVERFSNLETGQQATIDAALVMELIARAAVAVTPQIRRVLDIGCGAGNNTLKLLQVKPGIASDLLDLSAPMLARAQERVSAAGAGSVRTIQSDFRQADLPRGGYDVILAAAVLHHLRDDADWESAFRKIHDLLAPGGSVWVTDFIIHEIPAVNELMWQRYGRYLEDLGGVEYREKVFAYIEKEDSPRPLTYQLNLLRRVGFSAVEVLHKNSNFAAFGAVKPGLRQTRSGPPAGAMVKVIMTSHPARGVVAAAAWLRKQGLRATQSRIAIVGLLHASKVPLTLAEIHDKLAGESCDFATVFRFISILENKELVERVAWMDGTTRHEIRSRDARHRHHHYLICRTCQKVEPIEDCVVEDFEEQIAKDRGYAALSHSLQLSGVCPACQKPGVSVRKKKRK